MAGMMEPGSSIAVISPDGERGHRTHHIFAQTVTAFTDELVDALMDGRIDAPWAFALGCAAMLDMLSHDSVDFGQAVLTVEAAWEELSDVTEARADYTDALRGYFERRAS